MLIRDHIRSANAGLCLGGIVGMALGISGLVVGAPFAMTFLGTGACVWAASGVVSLVSGRLNPENRFRTLPFLAGLGAAAFCLYSFAGPGSEAQQNRNRFFTETRALVTQFERAANGTPQPRRNTAPLPPAPVHADKDTGWIGQAPGK